MQWPSNASRISMKIGQHLSCVAPAAPQAQAAAGHSHMTSDMTICMRLNMTWQVYDAKARFSEFLDATLREGPQVVTRRGVETAVLVPIDEWKHLKDRAKQSIPDPLLDPNGPHDLPVVPRRRLKLRPFTFDDGE